MTKAVALISGGLDSQLAAKLILEQGIEVIAVNFKSPFFGASPAVYKAVENLKIPLKILDFTDDHLKTVKAPKFGYGKNMNPCIDCHALMLNYAGNYMREIGADFLITGEVLGQRPKSQKIYGLNTVVNASGFKGYILRPLSAKLLSPTIPEEKGLVNRELLLDIEGRSRLRQMDLAEKYNLHDYPSPAGGCLLTDPGFSVRLRSFFKFEKASSPEDIGYLKVGRHFVLDDGAWLAIGRNKEENDTLKNVLLPKDYLIESKSHQGPDAVLRIQDIEKAESIITKATALTASYGKGKNDAEVILTITPPNGDKYDLAVAPTNYGLSPIQ